ncbi:sensor histidine kinase [Paenibacillus sedimenti]|uniref:histidine kinase n=1 Tax=Paenibacillus sedimenti TaxID=2770274 RepID=A0A926KWZ8_9BACL|nr:HAMP domain-containing sensor histidine kinase [Paenibacillus sedimenti]MBD0383768.1 HAMP domain-containing histidine kinase [Paenibacillus sedimenti]
MTLTSMLKKNEQDKKEADRVKREWISGISHDLKTPLTYISGYSSMLMKEVYPWSEEERKEFLSIIHRKADHLRELVQDLNQTVHDQIPLQRVEMDLIELVRRVAADIISAPWAADYFLTIDSMPEQLRMNCDPKLLTRALRNLLINAIAHNPAGTEIAIFIAQREPKMAEIRVEDNGVGFDETNQSHMNQGFPSSSRSGLGISIAKQLIQSHGGELSIRSQRDKGTTITIQMPTESI